MLSRLRLQPLPAVACSRGYASVLPQLRSPMSRWAPPRIASIQARFTASDQRQKADLRLEFKSSSTSSPAAAVGAAVNWVEKLLPAPWRPYAYLARLDKPIGTHLLFWPCAWSIALAGLQTTELLPNAYMIAVFGTGAIVMRGAGCTINDLWDRDIDRKVERTKVRPLASGAITTNQALIFLGGQLLVGLGVLTQLNMHSIILGFASMPLVIMYPLMKRITFWPQFVLGLTFNWGALLGWDAIYGTVDLSVCAPLYVSGVCWTLVYDTIYAHQDKVDDAKVGVRSTALLFANKTRLILGGFSAAMIAGLAVAGYNAGAVGPYYVAVLASAGHLAWQLLSVDLASPSDCFRKFTSNRWIGVIIFTGIAADAMWQRYFVEKANSKGELESSKAPPHSIASREK